MKISGVNSFNSSFNGLLKTKYLNTYGTRQNIKHSVTRTHEQVYYPFKDESNDVIANVLKKNNYDYSSENPELTGGIWVEDSCKTTLGPRLPLTKAQWEDTEKIYQDKIIALL